MTVKVFNMIEEDDWFDKILKIHPTAFFEIEDDAIKAASGPKNIEGLGPLLGVFFGKCLVFVNTDDGPETGNAWMRMP